MGFTLLADVPTTDSVSPIVSPIPKKLGAIVFVVAVGLMVTFATTDVGVTVTVTLFCVVPAAFVAASVYIVVVAGATITVPEVVCGVAVMPFNCSEVASLTCQESVTLCPSAIVPALDENAVIDGAEGGRFVAEFPLPPPPHAERKTTRDAREPARNFPHKRDKKFTLLLQ
jgi:hypothetical protein